MSDQDVSHREAHRLNGDAGANLVEYSLLLALIVVVCLSALSVFGRNATKKMSCVSSVITNEIANATC
jgi:Flp pilus assembly pilin Flp